MLARRLHWCGGVIVLVGVAGVSLIFAQRQPAVPPSSLLPKDTVLYVSADGGLQHLEAWKKTAAYESLVESGLLEVGVKLAGAIQQHSGGAEGIPGQVHSALKHILDHGVSLAATIGSEGGPPSPWAILVVHEAAPFEPRLSQLLVSAVRGEIAFETQQIGNRKVTRGVIPRTPGIELAWWDERGHLVIVAGHNAVDSAIKVAEGGANITAGPLWKEYATGNAGFEVNSVAWLDVAKIRETFGEMPLPGFQQGDAQPPVTVNRLAAVLGLDSLQTVVARSGYKGRALWSETKVVAPGPRKGLLALSDQEPLTLADLPPIPEMSNGFGASSFDWGKAFDTLLEVAHGVEGLLPESERGQVDRVLARAREELGIDLKGDLLDALGNVHCLYSDPNQMPLGLGFGLAIEVDDPAKLRSSVDALLTAAQREAGHNLAVRRVEKHGRQMIVLELGGGGFSPTLSIGEKWLAFGIVPQTVDSFVLREIGKLPRWEPSAEVNEALHEVPSKFTAITVSNPRPTYQMALGLAPFLMGGAQAAMRQGGAFPPDFELPVSTADVPPVELVTRPLFANVSTAGVDEDGLTYTARTSLPGAPLTGAMDGGAAMTTSAVLVALLLPAVQQAREAARRSQSQNNLKQILLALHNYHDTYQMFPEGTVPNEKLKPEERLSWQAKILPYIEQQPLFSMIDFEEGWEEEANAKALMTRIPVYQNPSAVDPPSKYATTHYIGIAGVGKDGPELPATSPKAGIFAYNRGTKISQILDGTSNTMAITDALDHGPWGAGGRPTIRALTQKPYINGPDGIGGPHTGGISVGMADGSVRFVSENIDPSVFEALATIRGGEVISDF